MPKPKKRHDRETWFVAVDILLFLVLLLFVSSMFFWDGGEETTDPSAVTTLKVLVSVDDAYFETLYREEGQGNPVRVRLLDEEEAFGTLEWVVGNTYLLRCDMEYVKESRYYSGVWELNDLRILNGTSLSLRTSLADFTATVLSSPSLELPDTDFLFVTEIDSTAETTKDSPVDETTEKEEETTAPIDGTTDGDTENGK